MLIDKNDDYAAAIVCCCKVMGKTANKKRAHAVVDYVMGGFYHFISI